MKSMRHAIYGIGVFFCTLQASHTYGAYEQTSNQEMVDLYAASVRAIQAAQLMGADMRQLTAAMSVAPIEALDGDHLRLERSDTLLARALQQEVHELQARVTRYEQLLEQITREREECARVMRGAIKTCIMQRRKIQELEMPTLNSEQQEGQQEFEREHKPRMSVEEPESNSDNEDEGWLVTRTKITQEQR